MARVRLTSLFHSSAVVAALWGPTGRLAAQSAQAPTLEEVIAIALERNPDVVTARITIDSAQAERSIARAYPNPSYAGIPNVPYQYSFSVPLDIGPERVHRTKAAALGEAGARHGYRDVVRQVVFQVRGGFYDVLLTEGLRGLAAERRDLMLQVLQADSARLEAGEVPERNVVKSELELARADAALARAEADVRAARLGLQALMGAERPDTGFTVRGELKYAPVMLPDDSLEQMAIEYRPDVAAAREHVEQSRSLQSLASTSWVPIPVASVVFQQDQPFSSGRYYSFGIGFEIPLWNWKSGERARATAGLETAQTVEGRVQRQVRNDVALAFDRFRSARSLALRYDSGLLTKAAAALETARYAYRSGAASLLDVLEAIRTYSDTRTDYLVALHDYWMSTYMLSSAIGRELVTP